MTRSRSRVAGPATAGAADADLAKLIEAAKKEGEVHYLDALCIPEGPGGPART